MSEPGWKKWKEFFESKGYWTDNDSQLWMEDYFSDVKFLLKTC